MNDVTKLPKWAQTSLADANRRASNAEAQLKAYSDSQTESLVFTRSGIRDKQFIQSDRVSFQLPNGEITVALRDGALECHASYGSARLLVVPHVTNVVWLEIQEGR